MRYFIYKTKAHLSQLLKKVKKGHSLTVTERGVPIAQIVPFSEGNFENQTSNMINLGIIKPSTSSSKITPLIYKKNALKRFLKDREN